MIPFGGDLANKILLLAWGSSDFSFPNIYENCGLEGLFHDPIRGRPCKQNHTACLGKQ